MPVFRCAKQRREQRPGIETRPAQPVDGTVAGNKSRAFAIANKGVVFDALCHGSVSVMITLNTRKHLPFS